MGVELIATKALDGGHAFENGPVPVEVSIQGFHSATLSEEGYQRTASLLTETMGFQLIGEEGNRFRYILSSPGSARTVDVLCAPEESRGPIGVGTVHHIAWRTANDEQQRVWLNQIQNLGYNVSPVMDRKYFHSIYFREPGGILFEIATDPPGFTIDEPLAELGTHLVLPPWLESSRSKIVSVLPQLQLPTVHQRA